MEMAAIGQSVSAEPVNVGENDSLVCADQGSSELLSFCSVVVAKDCGLSTSGWVNGRHCRIGAGGVKNSGIGELVYARSTHQRMLDMK
jgi:hypothetical protein